MVSGEQLSAYLAGELDPGEQADIEAELERDSDLRARLEQLERVDEVLRTLPVVVPPGSFSARLRNVIAGELAGESVASDHLAARREQSARQKRRSAPLRQLGLAAAAAAAIAVIGAGAGVLLRQGRPGSPQGAHLAAEAPATVTISRTDNDFDDRDLRRLSVNLDLSPAVPPGLTPEAAGPLSQQLVAQINTRATSTSLQDTAAAEGGPQRAERLTGADSPPADAAGTSADGAAVRRCLPGLPLDTPSPLVPVYIELARFDGEPAIIYAFAAQQPTTGRYDRVQIWAVAHSDCRLLDFAQYDR